MEFDTRVSYVLVAAMFLTQAVMLWLQLGASLRHKHRSFLLLAIGSVCGLLYLLINVVPVQMSIEADIAGPLFWVASALLATQMILSVWGTAELFQAYRTLSLEASQRASESHVTPNKSLEGTRER